MSDNTPPPNAADLARSCTTKKRYDSEATANTVALDCWHQRSVWLRAYACMACGGFHLTRSDAPPKMKPGWRMPEPSKQKKAQLRRARRRRNR